MYTVDANNVITRISDSKIIARDVTSKDYEDFLYVQSTGVSPQNGSLVAGFKTKHASGK